MLSQAGDPVGSPSVRVRHPDRRPPASAPTPSLHQSGSRLSGSPPQSLLPSHLSRVGERARASAPKAAPAGRQPQGRPQRAPVWVGSRAPSAGGGRGRPEQAASGPFAGLDWQRAGLRAAGARRDHKSDSGSGQMSCCLSTARAAAPALAFIISRIIGLNLIISSAVYSE